nr:SRPBCC family protein [Paenibacillus sp. sptzw28]
METCFDFARNIDVHTLTVWPHTREKAIQGITSGLINAGETVTFEATHLFVRQKLTSRITDYNRPYLFVDEMVKGAFKSLKHIHEFEARGSVTVMRDVLTFEAPLGVAGWIVERLILKHYMKSFIEDRNRRLKYLVENDAGR